MEREELKITKSDGVTIVDFSNNAILVADVVEEMGERLLALVAGDEQVNVIFDMAKVTFLSSPFLGLLLKFRDAMNERDGHFVLCGFGEELLKVFKTTKMDELFVFAKTMDSAQKTLKTTELPQDKTPNLKFPRHPLDRDKRF